MYFIDIRSIVDNLLTFDQLNHSRIEIAPFAQIIVEDVIVLYNSMDSTNLYDRVGHLTTTIGNNLAVEPTYVSVYEGIKEYTHRAGWDPRIKIQLSDYRGRDHSGEINQLLVVMDLDSTIADCYEPFNPTTSLGEMISDNPTPDQMSNFIQS